MLLELYKDKNQFMFLGFLVSLDYLLQPLLPNNPNVNQAAGALIVAGAGALIGAGVSMWNGKKNRDAASKAAGNAATRRNAQIALLNKEKAKYESFEFENPYANVENEFANIQTEFENTFEDLTVNQQQAQFQAQQGTQQRANIMQGMRGAAGGSGIAGLAQAMANQGQLQTQQISASIGQQESMNQKLLAQGAGREQDLERQAELQVARGEQHAEGQRLQGAETARGLDYSKTGTLLGMSQQRLGAANQARAQAKAQQMGAVGDIASAGLSMATAGMKMGAPGSGGTTPMPMDSLGPELLPVDLGSGPNLTPAVYPGS